MHRLTNVPGSSTYFPGGAVTYAYEAKQQILGVQAETLATFGAVSRQTAIEMARGVRRVFGTDYGMAVTGVAGPGGGTEAKPVGLTYIALCSPASEEVIECLWQSDREGNKALSADAALQLLYDRLNIANGTGS
jgi:nicotinamide-nucleotide amidase